MSVKNVEVPLPIFCLMIGMLRTLDKEYADDLAEFLLDDEDKRFP